MDSLELIGAESIHSIYNEIEIFLSFFPVVDFRVNAEQAHEKGTSYRCTVVLCFLHM